MRPILLSLYWLTEWVEYAYKRRALHLAALWLACYFAAYAIPDEGAFVFAAQAALYFALGMGAVLISDRWYSWALLGSATVCLIFTIGALFSYIIGVNGNIGANAAWFYDNYVSVIFFTNKVEIAILGLAGVPWNGILSRLQRAWRFRRSGGEVIGSVIRDF